MKYVIVGGTHAGIAAARTILKSDSTAEVVILEMKESVSYISSGINLYLDGVIDDLPDASYATPELLESEGIELVCSTEVLHVSPKDQRIYVIDSAGRYSYINYDKLILANGSKVVKPRIKGINNKNVVLYKNLEESQHALEQLNSAGKRIVIVGAGLVGLALASSIYERHKGENVDITFVEVMEGILTRYVDKEIGARLISDLKEKGMKFVLKNDVHSVNVDKNDKIVSVSTTDQEIDCDLVVFSVGLKPNNDFLRGTIELNQNNTIKINDYMQTSDENIYAAGDNVEFKQTVSQRRQYQPLVNNSVKGAIVAAYNCMGLFEPVKVETTQGTTGTKLFGYYIATTGITEENAPYMGLDVLSSTIEEKIQYNYVKDGSAIIVKVIYMKDTEIIVGAQLYSEHDILDVVNIMSVAINMQMTMAKLATMDFYFNPEYNKALNSLNEVALARTVKGRHIGE
ncbi:FAD-dependent oxidoreductase [Dellaglioa sp. BT-FLS60]